MSDTKYVNILARTHISTEFYLEVPKNASEDEIKEKAHKELVFPHDYPRVVDELLHRAGIKIGWVDSLMKGWDVDGIEVHIK